MNSDDQYAMDRSRSDACADSVSRRLNLAGDDLQRCRDGAIAWRDCGGFDPDALPRLHAANRYAGGARASTPVAPYRRAGRRSSSTWRRGAPGLRALATGPDSRGFPLAS
jgi:hypothetical protein